MLAPGGSGPGLCKAPCKLRHINKIGIEIEISTQYICIFFQHILNQRRHHILAQTDDKLHQPFMLFYSLCFNGSEWGKKLMGVSGDSKKVKMKYINKRKSEC